MAAARNTTGNVGGAGGITAARWRRWPYWRRHRFAGGSSAQGLIVLIWTPQPLGRAAEFFQCWGCDMQQIGYSLVDADGKVAFWGDEMGQCAGCRPSSASPNGDPTHGAHLGEVLHEKIMTLVDEERQRIVQQVVIEEDEAGNPVEAIIPQAEPSTRRKSRTIRTEPHIAHVEMGPIRRCGGRDIRRDLSLPRSPSGLARSM